MRPRTVTRGLSLLTAAALLLSSHRLEARETDDPSLQIHGFVSQGVMKSTENNYLAFTERGTFEFTEVALNLSRPLGENLRTGLQLFTRDLGPTGNYDARFDWFFLDWTPQDWFGLRAGRVRLPYGLYNTVSDYDPGRLWVLLPQSVYPATQRDFLLAATGLEAYGYRTLGDVGALSYSLIGGTLFIDPALVGASIQQADVPYVAFARLFWETPVQGLQVGGSFIATEYDIDVVVATQPLALNTEAILWIASVELERGRLLLAAEYARQYASQSSDQPAVAPPVDLVTEAFHVDAAWFFTPTISAGAYYAGIYPDVGDRSGREAYQHDIAATFRYDINAHWLVKLEAHYLYGTALLSPALNDDTPQSELEPSWGLLLAKTTAYF